VLDLSIGLQLVIYGLRGDLAAHPTTGRRAAPIGAEC
jgi:hypothetical protein